MNEQNSDGRYYNHNWGEKGIILVVAQDRRRRTGDRGLYSDPMGEMGRLAACEEASQPVAHSWKHNRVQDLLS